jgi:hypothetical protein
VYGSLSAGSCNGQAVRGRAEAHRVVDAVPVRERRVESPGEGVPGQSATVRRRARIREP